MEVSNWTEKATLGIGVLSIVVAIIVLLVNHRNQIRNRKVHIADKRQDWTIRFINKVFELITIQHRLLKLTSGYSVGEEVELFNELITVQIQVELMLPSGYSKGGKLLESIGIIFEHLNKTARDPSFVALEQMELKKIAMGIIAEQRIKISKLDSGDPFI